MLTTGGNMEKPASLAILCHFKIIIWMSNLGQQPIVEENEIIMVLGVKCFLYKFNVFRT